MSSPASVFGGLALGMLTTFLSASGLALQKRAHHDLAPARAVAAAGGLSVRSYTSSAWRFGMLFLIISALLSISVSALLGQALASSLAALTIVWALIIAACGGARCNKGLTYADGIAAGMCVAGTFAVAEIIVQCSLRCAAHSVLARFAGHCFSGHYLGRLCALCRSGEKET